jgi:membrane protease YdiL (CAAX protease family)
MIEWLIALGIGIAISMAIYAVSFLVMMTIVRKRKSIAKITLANPWMSSVIVSPVVLCLSLLGIFLLSMGMLPLWGFQIPPLELILLLSTIGLFTAIVVVLISEHLSPTPEKMNPPSDKRGQIFFFVIIVLLASIGEEVLFRGLLQNIIDNSVLIAMDLGWFSISSGAIVSAIIFGIVHIAPARQMGSSVPILVVSAALLGLLAGIFLTVSGSLILPIIAHIEFNLVGFILGARKE